MRKKQEINQAVRQAYLKGKSAEEIFIDLQKKHPEREALFETINKYPNLKNRKKYSVVQYALTGLILLGLTFSIKEGTYGTSILLAYLLYYLFQWNIKSYLYIYVLSGFSVLALSVVFLIQENNNFYAYLATLAYLFAVTLLAIYLDYKLSPKVKKKKVLVTLEDGSSKYRYSYSFKDK